MPTHRRAVLRSCLLGNCCGSSGSRLRNAGGIAPAKLDPRYWSAQIHDGPPEIGERAGERYRGDYYHRESKDRARSVAIFPTTTHAARDASCVDTRRENREQRGNDERKKFDLKYPAPIERSCAPEPPKNDLSLFGSRAARAGFSEFWTEGYTLAISATYAVMPTAHPKMPRRRS
jgi:hypothetical protein